MLLWTLLWLCHDFYTPEAKLRFQDNTEEVSAFFGLYFDLKFLGLVGPPPQPRFIVAIVVTIH